MAVRFEQQQLDSATASVVHVAAHGTHQAAESAVLLAPPGRRPLFAYEIDADPIAEHIVLSACELGQNTLRRGDETLEPYIPFVRFGSSWQPH